MKKLAVRSFSSVTVNNRLFVNTQLFNFVFQFVDFFQSLLCVSPRTGKIGALMSYFDCLMKEVLLSLAVCWTMEFLVIWGVSRFLLGGSGRSNKLKSFCQNRFFRQNKHLHVLVYIGGLVSFSRRIHQIEDREKRKDDDQVGEKWGWNLMTQAARNDMSSGRKEKEGQ